MKLFTRDKSGKAVPLIEEPEEAKPMLDYKDEKGRTILTMGHAPDGSLIPLEEALKQPFGYDSQGHAFDRATGRHVHTECRGRAHLQHFPALKERMSDAAQREYARLESGAESVVG